MLFQEIYPGLKFILVMILASSIGAASQAQVSLDPASQTVKTGQEFSINITIDPVNNQVAEAQFNLIFDGALVGIKNVVKGDIFVKKGITTFFNPGTPGTSNLGNVWEVITTPRMSATTRGTFVKVNLYSKKAGTMHPGLTKVMLSDPVGKSIPFILKNATINISGIPPAVNLIKNPGFESGTSPWLLYTSGTGTFSTASPGHEGNNAARLTFKSGGTNIQLYQAGITLEPNTCYRLSFSAYSTTGHDVTVNLFKHVSPYTTYAPQFIAHLGTSWQTFTTEFNSSGFTGSVNDGRFQFWLAPFAKAGDAYYIDDAYLEKVNRQ